MSCKETRCIKNKVSINCSDCSMDSEQILQFTEELYTRAKIRRTAKGRKSVEEGKRDRISDQLEKAAEIIEKLLERLQ